MKIRTLLVIVGLGALLSACSTLEFVTRDAPFVEAEKPVADAEPPVADTQIEIAQAPAFDPAAGLQVANLTVTVPTSLVVSEANSYLPQGDIVWREDPPGNRHEQVRKIVEDAMRAGVKDLTGETLVNVEVVVTRFHALTEKARYSIGGVHAITFQLDVRDPETGALLFPSRVVRADLNANGGRRAIAAEARGQTQKVRISGHLQKVIQDELTYPEGHTNARLGLIQALNRM